MRVPALLFLVLLLTCAARLAQAGANENTLMAVRNASGIIPYQGPCQKRNIDRHNSTAACYGGSDGMINIEYQDNSRVCVYVDHGDSAGKDLFVPLHTWKEWSHFRDAVTAGNLPELSLVYGCAAGKIQDACHHYQDMPDARDGDLRDIVSVTSYRAIYRCAAEQGCGSWELVTSSGSCPKDDGVCGTAQERTTHNPPTVNLCGWGTASAVSLSGGLFVWTCTGTHGGKTASCQARHGGVVDCGPLDRAALADLTMFSPGLCPADSRVSDFTRIGDVWYWFCNAGSGAQFGFGACRATYRAP